MRASRAFFASALAMAMAAFPGAGAANAMTEANTAQGEPYVSGGVALEEREALNVRRADFSLWIATAAKKTGSYRADVRVKIADAAGKVVLEAKLDGPWLLVNLQPGRYTVDASFDRQTQRKSTTIPRGGRRELLFYFDLEVETLPPDARG